MPKSLSDIAKKGRETKAAKRSTPTSTSITPTQQSETNLTTTSSKSVSVAGTSIKIPDTFTLESISGNLSKFDKSKYVVSDALNPPESLPQTNQANHIKLSKVFDQAWFSLDLEQQSAKLVGKQYQVLGERYKAFGEGVKASTEAEKVEGLLINHNIVKEQNVGLSTDYQIIQQNNVEKSNKLLTANHQATNSVTLNEYNKSISDEQVDFARLKVEELKLKNDLNKQKLLDQGWIDPNKK